MTEPSIDEHASADAQRARVEALRQRRALRVDASASPAAATGPASSPEAASACRRSITRGRRSVQRGDHARPRRRHGPRPASVLGDADRPGRHDRRTAPVPTSAATLAAPAATAAPGPAVAAPPVALTARPTVQVTTPTSAAPVARTNGSH